MKSDVRELVIRLREEVLGLDGWLLVNNGAGLLAVPVVPNWEDHYCCSPEAEPVPQEPKNVDAHDPHSEFYQREFGMRLKRR
jgi:hypothetical protein